MPEVLSVDDSYRTLVALFDPALAALGLNSVKRISYPSWQKHAVQPEFRLFLSLQVDSKATDPYSGGGFRLELEKTGEARPARGLNGRALFFQLLTNDELATLLRYQNKVIAEVSSPPVSQIALYPEGPVREQYLRYFQEQTRFDPVQSWFRYRTAGHLRTWAELCVPLLQPMIERGNGRLNPSQRHLGKGSLVG